MSFSCHAIARRSLVGALAAACFGMMLAGCSGNSADEVAVRNLVGSTMEEISQRTGSGAAFEFMNETTRQELTAYGVDAEAFAASALARMTYEVGEVHGDAEKATVAMDITNVSLGAAMERAADRFEEYSQSEASQTAYDEGGEAALMETLFTYLDEEIESAELETRSAELICVKVDGAWEIRPEDNAAFSTALYGV